MALFNFLKQVVQEFGRDKVGQLSAALAYTAVFAIGPLLLIFISIVGFIFGERAASGQLFAALADAIGPQTAETIQQVVANLHDTGGGILALIAGIVGVLLASAGLTGQLQNGFDAIFEVEPDPDAGIKRTVYVKLKGIFLIIIGSLLIAVTVAASAVVTALGKRLQDDLGLPVILLEPTNTIISLAIFALLLYGAYRTLPNVQIPRRHVLAAGLVIALLFLIGKIILAIVIGNNGTASAYGAAASLITLLLWVYYSSQILFIGAVGLDVYARNRAIIYEPKKYNVRRQTILLDDDTLGGKVAKSFVRGYKKAQKR